MVFFAQTKDGNGISVIDSLNGEIINTFYTHSFWVFNIYPNKDYTILAISLNKEPTLIFYNYENGQIIFELNYEDHRKNLYDYFRPVEQIIFTSNGEHLILNYIDKFLLYKINVIDSNTISINQINIITPSLRIYKILPLQENNIIIKFHSKILLYDISNLSEGTGKTYLIDENLNYMFKGLEISPSYNLLAYDYINKEKIHKLNIINFYDKSLITQIDLQRGNAVPNIKFINKDESRLVILDKYENQICVYDTFTGIKLHTFNLALNPNIIDIIINYNSEEDKDILIISNNKNITVYNLEDYSEKYTITSQKYLKLDNFKYIAPLQLW